MSEPNKSGKERHDLSQEEETNMVETLAGGEDLAETEPIQEAGKEPKTGGDVSEAQKLDNGAEAMDEDIEENSDEELEEEREVKGGGEETEFGSMEDQNANQVSDMFLDGEDSGNEDEQAAFMLELERFHKEHSLEYKPPKFYGKGLNCLKLWRQVIRLGGYETVTSCKLWRQVGESFRPPKTCTTVSWSFRIFYEKALLEYEKHKIRSGELQIPESSPPEAIATDRQVGIGSQGSNRVRRDAAQRAMEGWHSQRLLGNGEVGDPIIKDKSLVFPARKDKHVKNTGSFSHKKKKPSSLDKTFKDRRVVKSESDSMVIDVGPPADWVKVNVRQTKDCYEVYALVPGLLREEVHVQSDPAGRLVISGEPEQSDNPWGVTPFKKVISLPSRIDPHQTSAVVTLHGQLFVRVPFENSDV